VNAASVQSGLSARFESITGVQASDESAADLEGRIRYLAAASFDTWYASTVTPQQAAFDTNDTQNVYASMNCVLDDSQTDGA
jgi:hypothetical protein